MMRVISRDPFSRQDTVREETRHAKGCTECGGTSAKGKLWKYGVWRDGMRTKPEWSKGVFCSIGCWRVYTQG